MISRESAATANPPKTDERRRAEELPVVVYTPQSELSHPVVMFRGLIADLYAGRELAWRLFVRNLRAQHRQTFLGVTWILVPPVATTLLWVILQANRVVNFHSPAGVSYAMYVLSGTVLWGVFMSSLNCPMGAINGGREMLQKLRFPREALLMTGIGHILFNFLIQLALLIPAFVFFRTTVSSSVLLFPIGVAGLMLLGLGLGLLLTPIGLLYRDVGRAIGVFGRFWMYLTPVIYQPFTGQWSSLVNWFNPVAPVLTTTRDWLLVGQTNYLPGFLAFATFGLLATIVGLIVLRLAMPILIERS